MVDLAQEWERIQWIPDRRPIPEWAADHVTLPPSLVYAGKFNPAISRHFIQPLTSLQNGRIRQVCILAPPRSGKTLICDVWVPWCLAQDPGSVLMVFAQQDQAEKHCETRLMPVILGCAPIASLLSNDRHKTRKTEIQLANGYALHVFGPSTRNLQARGYRYLACDEVWQWEQGKIVEAKARVGDYRKSQSSKVLIISQGGELGGEWFAEYTAGTIHERTVPCDGCGVFQVPIFSGKHDDGRRYGLVWEADKNQDGSRNMEQAKASVRYVCRNCGHEHRNCAQTQGRWNAAGKYEAQDGGDPESHSFHWNDIVTAPWKDIVEDFIKARWQSKRGNWEPLLAFKRKRLAEFASESSVMQEEQPAFRIDMTANMEWPDEVARFCAVDVQEGHFWVMIRAWAKNGESRRLHWGRAEHVEDIEEICKRHNVPPKCVIIDSAHQSRAVYAIAAKRGWVCIKGADKRGWSHKIEERGQLTNTVEKPWSPMIQADTGLSVGDRRIYARLFHISKPATADRLRGLRDTGLWVEPKVEPMTEEEKAYQAQMDSMIKIRKATGMPEEWVQTGTEPHAWDCARMQVWLAMNQRFA